MRKFKSINTQSTEQTVDKKALIFGLTSVLLYGIGFGLTIPVVPFLVQPYVRSPGNQAMVVALLTFVYAVCVFLAAPGLGALSDRYGRRPVLIICLLGSAAGYLIFGIGGALWVLFLGRIIDGLTGGNISTILAYFADITPKEQRTKYFGWAGAASGIGFIIGPTLGGLLAKFGYSTPMYFGVIITLLNVVYGVIYMPESLSKDHRLAKISFVRLNPFTQFASIFSIKNLKWIFIAIFLLGIPTGSLQTFFSQFAKDTFNWEPVIIGLVFSILGATDIITQSLIMPKLLMKLKDDTNSNSWHGLRDYSLWSHCGIRYILILSLFYRGYNYIWFWRRHFWPGSKWDSFQVCQFRGTRQDSRRQSIHSGFDANNRANPWR